MTLSLHPHVHPAPSPVPHRLCPRHGAVSGYDLGDACPCGLAFLDVHRAAAETTPYQRSEVIAQQRDRRHNQGEPTGQDSLHDRWG